jgi:hypothetical protein
LVDSSGGLGLNSYTDLDIQGATLSGWGVRANAGRNFTMRSVLVGAVIASNAPAGYDYLETGTLVLQDQQNLERIVGTAKTLNLNYSTPTKVTDGPLAGANSSCIWAAQTAWRITSTRAI